MAPFSAQEGGEEEEAEEEEPEVEEDEEEAPSHLPLAPPSESDDISTTVDPSYIISLIRQLLPHDVNAVKHPQKTDSNGYAVQESETYSLDQNLIGVCHCEKTKIAIEAGNLTANYGESFNHNGDFPSDSNIENDMSQEIIKEKSGDSDDGQTEHSDKKDPWEDCGCILWDLSASRTHAEFMVNNLLLEVLLANLHVSKSFRVMEICLGIIGNLACHNALSELIVSKDGLIETVVGLLSLDDSACLSELFRIFAVSLQGREFVSWAAALLPEQVLLRILWIVGNTLNFTLLERSIEFFSAIINNQEVAAVLLQPLIEMGLPNLVVSLLTCEISKIKDENKLERSSVLEMILQLVEALSATDGHSQVISSDEFFPIICDVVKLPDKIEVASSCVSAVVIIANLMLDEQNLTSELSQDFLFLHGLLDMFPFVSDDPQARNALWCILARLLDQVQENDINVSTLHQFVLLFQDKSYLIEEDLDGHPMQNLGEDQSPDANEKSHEMVTSLRRIACILEKWIVEKFAASERDVAGSDDDSSKVHRLLDYCHKHGA